MTNSATTQPAIIQGSSKSDLRALLTCGHYSGDIFNRSSTWDFPEEVQDCPQECPNPYFTDEVLTALQAQSPNVHERIAEAAVTLADFAAGPDQNLVFRFQNLIADMVEEGHSPDTIGASLRYLGFGR